MNLRIGRSASADLLPFATTRFHVYTRVWEITHGH